MWRTFGNVTKVRVRCFFFFLSTAISSPYSLHPCTPTDSLAFKKWFWLARRRVSWTTVVKRWTQQVWYVTSCRSIRKPKRQARGSRVAKYFQGRKWGGFSLVANHHMSTISKFPRGRCRDSGVLAGESFYICFARGFPVCSSLSWKKKKKTARQRRTGD